MAGHFLSYGDFYLMRWWKLKKFLTTALKGFLECPKQVLIHCKHSLNLIIWWKNASNNWTTSYNYGRLVNLIVSYVSSNSVKVTVEHNTYGQMHKSEPKYFIIQSTLVCVPRCHARVHKEHKGTITDLHHLFPTFGLLWILNGRYRRICSNKKIFNQNNILRIWAVIVVPWL